MNSQDAFCTMTLVRHGETEANLHGILQGQFNSPLSATGELQVAAAGRALAEEHFDAVYSSDLGRTMRTASVIASCLTPVPDIRPEPALREWGLGKLEGRPFGELLRDYPELMQSFRRSSAWQVSIPGGESGSGFQERISSCLERLAAAHAGQHILLVTHGGALQCVFRHCVGQPSASNLMPLADNASITRLCCYSSGPSWRLITWNSCAHLRGIALKPTLSY